MSQAPKVLVCDDHPIVVMALRSELSRTGGFSEVDTASSVSAILDALNDPKLGIVITDFSFNEAGDGLQLIGRIKRMRPDVAVIVFSMSASPPVVRDMIAAGASAFVSKDCGMQDVAGACRSVLAGKRFVAPASLSHLLDQDQDEGGTPQAALQRLSPREREVLRLLAQGLSIREIGARFNRSIKTISVQKCAAMAKLGLTQDMELGRYLASAGGTQSSIRPSARSTPQSLEQLKVFATLLTSGSQLQMATLQIIAETEAKQAISTEIDASVHSLRCRSWD